MNINCVICADLFISADSIVAAGGCGHCFHFHCLTQWLERSKTCPQCRSKCTQRNIVRIFLNINTGSSEEEDPGQLINKVDNLTFQVRERDGKILELNKQVETQKADLEKHKKNIKSLNKAIEVNESLINAYKEEMKMLRVQASSCDHLRKEIKQLQEKLETLKAVDEVMTATATEVDEMIKRENDPRVLGVLVASLKREMKHGESRKKLILDSLKNIQQDHRREMEKRKQLEERVNHLESENYRLEQELAKTNDNSRNESLLKSPDVIPCTPPTTTSPPRRKLKLLTRSNMIENAMNSVSSDQTGNSQSPYLFIKSSSIGLSPLLNKRKEESKTSNTEDPFEKYSIFKKPRLTAPSLTTRPTLNWLKERPQSASMVVKKISATATPKPQSTIGKLNNFVVNLDN